MGRAIHECYPTAGSLKEVIMCKAPYSALTRLDDKRSTSSMSLVICCMDTFVSFPSEIFKIYGSVQIN